MKVLPGFKRQTHTHTQKKGRLTIACFIISRRNASLAVSLTLGVCLTQVKSAQLLRESEITHSQGTVNSTGLKPECSRLHSTPQGPCQANPELSFKGSHGTGPGPVNVAGPLTSVSPGVSLPSGSPLHCYAISPSILYDDSKATRLTISKSVLPGASHRHTPLRMGSQTAGPELFLAVCQHSALLTPCSCGSPDRRAGPGAGPPQPDFTVTQSSRAGMR